MLDYGAINMLINLSRCVDAISVHLIQCLPLLVALAALRLLLARTKSL